MLRLILGVGFPFFISAQWGNRYCENGNLPIVLLHRNATTGVFTLVKRIPANETKFEEGDFRQRRLERKDLLLLDAGGTHLRSAWVPGLLLKEERKLQSDFIFGNEISGPANDPDATVAPTTTATTMKPDEDPTTAMQEDGTAKNEEYFYARECSCFPKLPTVYCPFVADVCQEPDTSTSSSSGDQQQLPGCLTLVVENETQSQILIYLTIVGFWMVGGLCIFTKFGRSAVDYPISWCIPGWTQKRVRQMMQEDPHRTARLLQAFARRRYLRMERLALEASMQTAWTEEQLRQQQRQTLQEAGVTPFSTTTTTTTTTTLDPQEPPTSLPPREVLFPSPGMPTHARDPLQPVSFSLRTCTFRKKVVVESANNSAENELGHEDTEDSSCTICFAPLVNGERVGALACKHVFHVDCLKMWVKRRNVCPLCQTREIATPLFAHDEDEDDPKIFSNTEEDSSSATDISSNGRSMQETTIEASASHDESEEGASNLVT